MNMPTAPINFYSTKGEYGCFSNFARTPFVVHEKIWPTAEHYFQAQKFPDAPEYQEKIRATASPMVAARLGRSRAQPIREDWEKVKDGVMREAVRLKFRHNSELREVLLATGDAVLVEHTTKDKYWGDGGDGSGQNMLGRILMEVRSELAQGRL
ncbi:MAG TPA: NADAR family protein [Trichormus sp.]|jgi:hypothetical protein